MEKKFAFQLAFLNLRALIAFFVCGSATCSILSAAVLGFLRSEAPAHGSQRMLTFAERVAYQYAIEEVYWRHRIWPKENPNPKPPLDAVMSQAQLEKEVSDYLRKSQALEDYWQRPITAEQLQAEMDRMAQRTKQPEVLRELFAALGNDPFVIAECLARPALAERLLSNWYARDERIHGKLKQRAEADLRDYSSVAQMKRTSGEYNEVELIESDNRERFENSGSAQGSIELPNSEWNQSIQKLAAIFTRPAAVRTSAFGELSRHRGGIAALESADTSAHAKTTGTESYESLPVGKLSQLQEDATRYYATAVTEKSLGRLKLATVTWLKESVESWLARAERQPPSTMIAPAASYTLPQISDVTAGCVDDTWTATLGPPDGRQNHTAAWTGSEMIVWGGALIDGGLLNSGGRYNPSTDTWTVTSTANSPTARYAHTVVWTGSEMIVWGGYDGINVFNTGGRYNPTMDSWTATTNNNAPSARAYHTAVWAGSEMIVWGGSGLNTGGKYNPDTDSWTATTTNNAPAPRAYHSAVWTGREMIVWGGFYNLNTGGKYNPDTDSWTATSTTNAPSGRAFHSAVWTGSEMIVWGGYYIDHTFNPLNTGGRYNPGTDSWTDTSITNPPSPRYFHTAVWTGAEMIVWGGTDLSSNFSSGGRYNPATDSWTATSTIDAPSARANHTAAWAGSEMIVWGGNGNTGGRYSPSTDTWVGIGTNNAPSARYFHTAVWTGSEMIIWGGSDTSFNTLNSGGRYDPIIDNWIATSTTNAAIGRSSHTAVWTGTEMIVWGGYNQPDGELNSGGRYNPMIDSWIATTTANAPMARGHHTAVWSGSEMIVWGGYGCGGNCNLYSGGRYNPGTDSWTPTSTVNVPSARWDHTAVWTGTEMIVWGGTDAIPNHTYLHTGGRYNPTSDSWTPTSLMNVPLGRIAHTAVWTGSEMIVWGGADETFNDTNTGGAYNPTGDSWAAIGTTNAPAPRDSHTAVWTGSEMIIWSGYTATGRPSNPNTGGRYNPGTDSWTPTSTVATPIGRSEHTAVWTGTEMIVWGGRVGGFGYLNSGGRYCAESGPTPTPTPGQILLRAKKKRIEGINTVRLQWREAISPNIDVYRNNVLIVTTPNDGRYDDSTSDTGRAHYVYRVCEGGTQTCSNDVTVNFPP
jgi:N-acetylneuraminic acid mutarotase